MEAAPRGFHPPWRRRLRGRAQGPLAQAAGFMPYGKGGPLVCGWEKLCGRGVMGPDGSF